MQESLAILRSLHAAAFVLLLAFSVSVHGIPSVNLPINAQVPPVARPDQAYNFVFSDSTFSWAGNSINYSLTNHPGWLQLDSSSRILSGIPGSADIGSVAVGLVATDETGSSSMSVTFVVSADPGPGLGDSVAEQLPAFGPVPSPDSLSLAPSSALSLSFSPNTFTNTNANTVYYAICANNTPLPSWVSFHPSSLTFSGTTPSWTSPWELPQAFRIQLIASNVLGFAEAVTRFQLVITNHLFAFGNKLHVINITSGKPLNFSDLQSDLTLDGQPSNASDIRQVVASTPPWMSINSSTLTLSGTPPPDAASQNFTVTASDIYGDTTSTLVMIRNIENLTSSFTGPFAAVNATIGTNFTYDLKSQLPSNSTADVAVNVGAASVWLTFNSDSLELLGHVPADLKPQSIQVIVTTTQGSQSQSQNLTINIQDASAPSARPTASHSMPPKATSGSTAGDDGSENATGLASCPKRRWVAAAIIVPIFISLICLLLLCLYLKRRQRRKAKEHLSSSARWEISPPIQEKDVPKVEERETTTGDIGDNEIWVSSWASRPPWLDALGDQTLDRDKCGSEKRLSNNTVVTIDSTKAPDSEVFSFSGWEKGTSVPEASRTSEKRTSRRAGMTSCGLKASPSAVERLSVIVDDSPAKRTSKRQRRRSNLSYDNTSVFSSQRLSGIGHGRNTLSRSSSNFRTSSQGVGHGNCLASGPPGFGIVRNSWRNLSRSTWTSTDGSSDQWMDREATVGESQTNSRPPTSNRFGKRPRSHVIHEVSDDEGPPKTTLWPVPLSARSSLIKRKSSSLSRSKSNHHLQAHPLQSFHKRRLQQRSSANHLFSAGPSSSRLASIRASKAVTQGTSASQAGSTEKETKVSERPITIQSDDAQRTYSESSSLDPPVRPSASRSLGSSRSPRRQKSYIKYHLNTRAVSPSRLSATRPTNSRGSSWVSTSSDSKFGSAASDANPTFTGFGDDLREETDENGNRRWLHGHPNPLGTHRVDVTDQELIDSLRARGHVGAAQRLSYLRKSQTTDDARGGGAAAAESGDEGDAQVKIGSTRGRRLGQNVGLRQGDPGNLSMRGDLGNTKAEDAAESAFI